MAPAVIGDHIEMTALHAGQLLYRLSGKGCVEKPDEKKNRYQITQKGQQFLTNPPEATKKKQPLPKPPSEPPDKPQGEPQTGAEHPKEEPQAAKKDDLGISFSIVVTTFRTDRGSLRGVLCYRQPKQKSPSTFPQTGCYLRVRAGLLRVLLLKQ
jgi:hypothetical protein